MIISLLLACAATLLFGRLVHLTGLGPEDAVILLQLSRVKIDAQGLLWAGILIGAVGVLDDVPITSLDHQQVADSRLASSELRAQQEPTDQAIDAGQPDVGNDQG